jgi:hypothetical protein
MTSEDVNMHFSNISNDKFSVNDTGCITGQCIGDMQNVSMSFGSVNNEPVMTTIGNRPAKVARLHSIDGTYVQCRLPSGDDAFVPLSDVFAAFEKALVAKARNRAEDA